MKTTKKPHPKYSTRLGIGIFTIILILTLSTKVKRAHAQDSPISLNFSGYTGTSSLTSGNTFSFVFTKNKSSLTFDLNDDLGELIYLYSPKEFYSFGFSGGFLNNTLWFGPIGALSSFEGHLKVLIWEGWSHGDTEEGNTEIMPRFCFSFIQTSINFSGFDFSYANQIYQKNPMEHIFCIKKIFKIYKNVNIFASGGYMLYKEKFLYSGGVSIKINNLENFLNK